MAQGRHVVSPPQVSPSRMAGGRVGDLLVLSNVLGRLLVDDAAVGMVRLGSSCLIQSRHSCERETFVRRGRRGSQTVAAPQRSVVRETQQRAAWPGLEKRRTNRARNAEV